MRTILFIAPILLATALAAPPLEGQRAPSAIAIAPQNPGWLGIGFDVQITQQRAAPGSNVVEQVNEFRIQTLTPGGPAERAGLRPGDRVLAFDGTPATLGVFSQRVGRLQSGDTVVLRVERDGRIFEQRIEATPRPAGVAALPIGAMSVTTPNDSIQHALRRQSDSLRAEAARIQRETFDMTLRRMGADSQVVVLRFRGPVDQRIGMAATFQGERIILRPTPAGAPTLTVHAAGQRVVAGAELAPLNPQLARYFDTDHGVLVVDVLEGTPAARAGVQPGDVVVQVSGVRVHSIEELRARMEAGYRAPPVPVVVIREGNRVNLNFPR